MQPSFVIALVVSAIASVGTLQPGPSSIARERPARAPLQDTTWYHASDVARLARTGRPQLLEFFHPT